MPSLPTTAVSAEMPFSVRYSSETRDVVGRITWLSLSPDSYNTCPKGHVHGLQMRLPALPFVIGQGRQQPVLTRVALKTPVQCQSRVPRVAEWQKGRMGCRHGVFLCARAHRRKQLTRL